MSYHLGLSNVDIPPGKDVTQIGYKHFSEPSAFSWGKCLLHDDTDKRHKEDVEKAEKKAREEVRAENPHLTDADLEIRMSDAAKTPTAGNREAARYAPRFDVLPEPHPIGHIVAQAQVDAQQMHAAMMNNNIAHNMAMQQRRQMQQVQRAAAADWPRPRGIPRPPNLDVNQFLPLQQPDPYDANLFRQHRPFDPAGRHPQFAYPAPIAMGAAFPAFGDVPQPDRVPEGGRFGADARRNDRHRGGRWW